MTSFGLEVYNQWIANFAGGFNFLQFSIFTYERFKCGNCDKIHEMMSSSLIILGVGLRFSILYEGDDAK